jgi:predicted transcriptional regulator
MVQNSDPVLEELATIRKLLVFAVMNMPGISQEKLAKALGVSQSSVSRMLGTKTKGGK